ncbi:hypothetical protein W97_00941 [Coniosporium apollinis CBS 100218]|uniref:ASST-domain-containing protein n=1 Tax=Coniosporium apollinis (strain CBS 100218) TaxID=1168221 RepID=R7YII6_CONA1|nr:uncharacterized protein W97_00941 [Coniosporium apollinis CBS 100218]EON61725.1 hypothetical protein W97_00941 [Coniosporium apollinis CBS 100218]
MMASASPLLTWRTTIAFALAFLGAGLAQNTDNVTEPLSTFKSRPDILAPALNVSIQNSSPEGFAPGYIFIAPFQATQTGPYIYDKFGNLIWSGYGTIGPGNVHDFKVCSYGGADHLCAFQGNQRPGYALGHGIILDETYTIVKTVQMGTGASSMDMHEFSLISGGDTALAISYQPAPMDLTAYGITFGQGWIMQGVFQEINVTSGEVLFSWSSLGHIPPLASGVMPNTTDVSGTGLTPQSPWDYFHINSVEKSPYSSDYLISVRHTSSIYLIDSSTGAVLWTLSSDPSSTYALQNFNFSFQHDARFLADNSTHTILSLFDNASNGFTRTATESSTLHILLDHTLRTATLLARYMAPVPGGLLSDSQANSQTLPNGHIFTGWGSVAAVSEVRADGEPVLFATFGRYPIMNYRAYSFEWVGRPLTAPSLAAFARDTAPGTPMSIYASWNGATEVREWVFHGSAEREAGFTVLGSAAWEGFETEFVGAGFNAWVYAEAVDGAGTVLGRSATVGTVVSG